MGKSSLFLRAFSVWALLVIFLLSCSSPPPTPIQALSSPPKVPTKNSLSGSQQTLNSDNFSPFFKRFPAQQNIPVMKPAPYSTKAASNPDRCVTGLGGEPTSIQGTMNLYLGFGSANFGDPIPYGLDIFDGLNLRNGTDESKVSMNFRYFAFNSNGIYAGVYITNALFPRLKTGQIYTATLTDSDTVADARGYAAGPASATLNLSIGENSLTALVSGTSKVSVDGYNRYSKTDFNALATTAIQTGPCAPVIDLTAAPKLIEPAESSHFTITPENTQIPWVLEVTGPEGYFQTNEDIGNSTPKEYLLQGPLPAGDYHAVAYYKAYPEYKARVTIMVRPKIELSVSPTLLNPISNNPENNKAIITVKPKSLTLPWTLTIDKPDGTRLKTYQGTGEPKPSPTLEGITPEGRILADGEYLLHVAYDAFPQEGAPGNITVKSSRNLELTANPSALTVDGSEQIAEFVLETEGSLLPWTLNVIHPDGFASTTTGSGNKNESLPQPLKAGVYTATAQFDGYPETLKTALMTITVPPVPTPTIPVTTPTPSVSPTSEPTSEPTGEPTGEPTDEPPCPTGQICPTPGPTATQCPVGQVCPTPTPIITPTPRPTVTPTPRPTPTPEDETCPAEPDAAVKQSIDYSVDSMLSVFDSFTDEDFAEIDSLFSSPDSFRVQALSVKTRQAIEILEQGLKALKSATTIRDIATKAQELQQNAARLRKNLEIHPAAIVKGAASSTLKKLSLLHTVLEFIDEGMRLTILVTDLCQKLANDYNVGQVKGVLDVWIGQVFDVLKKMKSGECARNADEGRVLNLLQSLSIEVKAIVKEFQPAIATMIKSIGPTPNQELRNAAVKLLENVTKRIQGTSTNKLARVQTQIDTECKPKDCIQIAREKFIKSPNIPVKLEPNHLPCIVYRGGTYPNVKTWTPRDPNDTHGFKAGLSTFSTLAALPIANKDKYQIVEVSLLQNPLIALYNGDNGHVSIVPSSDGKSTDFNKLSQWAKHLSTGEFHQYSLFVQQARIGEGKK